VSDESGVERIDLEKVDWRGSREFFESLGEALDKLDGKDESYDFTWVGKRKSIIEAGAPINKTFRPEVEASKNWDTTENLFIEGDNLDALKLLQESYLGKVKMIYIDPPYNTGKDFVYRDNFKATTEQYDEDTEYHDEDGNIQFKKNEKSNGRYHSDWLSMMYPRLKLARNLLSDDGVIFISIDDNEQANLKKLCDEVFGEDNCIATITWQRKKEISNDTKGIAIQAEYLLVYSRSSDTQLAKKPLGDEYVKSAYKHTDSKGIWRPVPMTIDMGHKGGGYDYEIITPSGSMINRKWRMPKATYDQLLENDEVYFGKSNDGVPQRKKYLDDSSGTYFSNLWDDTATNKEGKKEVVSLFGFEVFDTIKPTRLIREVLSTITEKDGLILDFFSGSATTAHAVMQLNAEDGGNRKWIMVQLPEETDEKSEAFKAGYKTIPEISRERIRRAGDKIADEHPDARVDYGFRALRIDDTNYKEVYKPAGEQQQSTLLNLVDNIKDDRSELDLLYGVITQSALELNRPLETRKIAGSDVFLYDYFGEVSGLAACFGDSISEETIKEIAKLKPLTAVFRDSTFPDSQAKVNLGEHFRILSAETKVKVI
jgi:adenine-specific DNA-methyltransferase